MSKKLLVYLGLRLLLIFSGGGGGGGGKKSSKSGVIPLGIQILEW